MGEVRDLFGVVEDSNLVPEVGAERARFPRLPRYAEFMVCAFLTKQGHYCVHVDAMGFDIILDYDGNSYRIDVKSTDNYQRGALKESCEWDLKKASYVRGPRYTSRPIGPSEVDLLALYHLDFDTVIFIPVLRPMSRIAFPAAQVRAAGDGSSTLMIAIEQVRRGQE